MAVIRVLFQDLRVNNTGLASTAQPINRYWWIVHINNWNNFYDIKPLLSNPSTQDLSERQLSNPVPIESYFVQKMIEKINLPNRVIQPSDSFTSTFGRRHIERWWLTRNSKCSFRDLTSAVIVSSFIENSQWKVEHCARLSRLLSKYGIEKIEFPDRVTWYILR